MHVFLISLAVTDFIPVITFTSGCPGVVRQPSICGFSLRYLGRLKSTPLIRQYHQHFQVWMFTGPDVAHIVRLPVEFGRFRFRRGGMAIRAANENRCSGSQVEGHGALAWLVVVAPFAGAPV